MTSLSNYRAILLTSEQYRTVANTITFKNVIHFNPPINKDDLKNYLDSFWFRLGYGESITLLVVSKPYDIINKLVNVGLIYDLRNMKLPSSSGGLYDLLLEILNGNTKRISLCNDIRNVLADREMIRWCGAELESIFNENVCMNATEICGNSPPGRYFSVTKGVSGSIPIPMNEKHLRTFFDSMLALDFDPGQNKLGSIAYALPRLGYDLIYIGGSPGSLWTWALEKRRFRGKILCIDPDPMLANLTTELNVVHIEMYVYCVDDILTALLKAGMSSKGNYILVWDVRNVLANVMPSGERNDMIRNEIAVLNGIIFSQWFKENVKIYQLKINNNNLDSYELPKNTKLYVQPFTLDRGIYEIRAVGFNNGVDLQLHILDSSQIVEIRKQVNDIKMELCNGSISNYTLFLNFMTSAFRECDYIDEVPLVKNNWEIALYTLNWNSTVKLQRYFRQIKERNVRFIGSFFTKKAITEKEYVFPEHLLLDVFPSFVFDSRALISAKIEGLYFFANSINCRYMENELVFSESYLIGATEYDLHTRNLMPQYDLIRTQLSEDAGCKYAKFPNAFSASNSLVSPSGHSLRMFIEYINGNASLCMFAFKIVSNFYAHGKKKIREPVCELLFPEDSNDWLSSISRNFDTSSDRLEKADDAIWHSKLEWILGYKSGSTLCGNGSEALNEVINFIERAIDCNLKGIEIFKYRQSGWSELSQSSIRLPRLENCQSGDMHIVKIAKIYSRLKKLKISDWVHWILDASHNNKISEWRWAVYGISLDLPARDFLVHSAYIRTISNKYNNHDSSKKGLLELILNSLIQISPTYSRWAVIPHYLANDHHPECASLRRLFPDLLQRIYVIDDFFTLCDLLRNASKYIDDNLGCSYDMPFNNYDELAVDLIARRWQKVFPFHRVVNSNQLGNVHEYTFRKPNIDMNILDEHIHNNLPPERYFLKRDVENALENLAKNVYP